MVFCLVSPIALNPLKQSTWTPNRKLFFSSFLSFPFSSQMIQFIQRNEKSFSATVKLSSTERIAICDFVNFSLHLCLVPSNPTMEKSLFSSPMRNLHSSSKQEYQQEKKSLPCYQTPSFFIVMKWLFILSSEFFVFFIPDRWVERKEQQKKVRW